MQQAVRAQIRAEMGRKGIIQADIARATGKGTNSLSRWLNDSLDLPINIEVLEEISEVLGTEPETIIANARRFLRESGEDV